MTSWMSFCSAIFKLNTNDFTKGCKKRVHILSCILFVPVFIIFIIIIASHFVIKQESLDGFDRPDSGLTLSGSIVFIVVIILYVLLIIIYPLLK